VAFRCASAERVAFRCASAERVAFTPAVQGVSAAPQPPACTSGEQLAGSRARNRQPERPAFKEHAPKEHALGDQPEKSVVLARL